MSRATYCRDQARLCRDLAAQIGLAEDAQRLRGMADRYDAEAEGLEPARLQQQQQQQSQQQQQPQQQQQQQSKK